MKPSSKTFYKLLAVKEYRGVWYLVSWSVQAALVVYRPRIWSYPHPMNGPLAVFATAQEGWAFHQCSTLYTTCPTLLARCQIVPSMATEAWSGSHCLDRTALARGTVLADAVKIVSAVAPKNLSLSWQQEFCAASYERVRALPQFAALFPPVKGAAKKTKEAK